MKKPRPNAALPPFPAARFDDALLRRIAATADHGAEAERHHAALRRIVREQNGLIDGNSQAYYPADALELCALGQADGNAAAFALSYLLIVRSALAGSADIRLASGFLRKKCPNARKKAQQGWTPAGIFDAAGGYFLPKTPP